tara:strand:+ start:297 stop:776 length:480 start_codon:yes stop_codon:yes gene_type:complete
MSKEKQKVKIPSLKYPRGYGWRKPDYTCASEVWSKFSDESDMNETMHPLWDNIFVDWITEKALSEDELFTLYEFLDDPKNRVFADRWDRAVFKRATFSGGGLVIGWDKRGLADEIPAMLEDGVFILTSKSVRELGLTKLYRMLKESDPSWNGSSEKPDT